MNSSVSIGKSVFLMVGHDAQCASLAVHESSPGEDALPVYG